MLNDVVKKYQKLNELAEQGGIVLFGCGEDLSIPLCEIKQSFSVDEQLYNRSVSVLSLADACEVYRQCVASLKPDTLFLHLGAFDQKLFTENPGEFSELYSALIKAVKQDNPNCSISVVSLKNEDNDECIASMNKLLKDIATVNLCEFTDISHRTVWNPKSSMATSSFLHSIGFVRPLKQKRSSYDLARMLYQFA